MVFLFLFIFSSSFKLLTHTCIPIASACWSSSPYCHHCCSQRIQQSQEWSLVSMERWWQRPRFWLILIMHFVKSKAILCWQCCQWGNAPWFARLKYWGPWNDLGSSVTNGARPAGCPCPLPCIGRTAIIAKGAYLNLFCGIHTLSGLLYSISSHLCLSTWTLWTEVTRQ